MSMPVPEDNAETSGPNASLPFGDATRIADLQRQTGQLATGPSVPQGPGQAAPMTQAPAPPPPPVQPSPQFDFDPGNPSTAFLPEKMGLGQPIQSFREEWTTQALHPQAGPMLKEMAKRAQQRSESVV